MKNIKNIILVLLILVGFSLSLISQNITLDGKLKVGGKIKIGNLKIINITKLEVFPKNITIKCGDTLRFTAIAYNSFGTAFTPSNLRWYATGGVIYQDGRYVAGTRPGWYTVTASSMGYKATTRVYVKRIAPRIVRIEVIPSVVSLTVGKSYRFKARAYDSFNRPVPFVPLWQVTGGGTIDNTGLFRALYVGTYTVTAKDPRSNTFGSARVVIKQYFVPKPVRLVIYPSSTTIRLWGKVNFRVKAYDQLGNVIGCNPVWRTNGGSITQSGVYTGTTIGTFTVWVKDRNSGLTATATVTVRGSCPPPVNARIVIEKYDVGGGNFFRPKAKIQVRVYGYNASYVKLYAVSSSGLMRELKAYNCTNGSRVYFKTKYDRFFTRWLEIRLYDNMGRVIARVRRAAH